MSRSRFLSHLISARQAAHIVRAELAAGDDEMALRIVTQSATDFDKTESPTEMADFLAPAESTGDERFDVLIATIVRWKAVERGLEPPSWTEVPALGAEWVPGSIGNPLPEYLAWVREGTPTMFKEKNILALPKSWRAA
jgi:hypothetical protein